MNIKKVMLHEIRPYENNVKHHPVKQLEAIVESIKQFGFRQPIVLDKNNVIVAGHARYEAAAALGMEFVPCEYADDLTDLQVKAYRILDNEIAQLGSTDSNALSLELSKMMGFDFSQFNVKFDVTDFDPGEIPEEKDPPEPKHITCPNCDHVFTP